LGKGCGSVARWLLGQLLGRLPTPPPALPRRVGVPSVGGKALASRVSTAVRRRRLAPGSSLGDCGGQRQRGGSSIKGEIRCDNKNGPDSCTLSRTHTYIRRQMYKYTKYTDAFFSAVGTLTRWAL